MNKRLEISIPKSCSENWNSMSTSAGGHYCSSCSKEVSDFTAFSEKELQDYFHLHQGEKICGRFLQSQLSLQPEQLPKSGSWTLLRTEILAASVLIFPFTLKAAPSSQLLKQTIASVPLTRHISATKSTEKPTLPTDTLKTIKGIILDKTTKETLPGVDIKVKGTTIKSVSNANGNFQISLDKEIKPVLLISYLGYQSLEQEVGIELGKPVTLLLQEDATMLTGEVCIVRKPGLFKRLFRPFKK